MPETITIDKIYDELKTIERKMVTKEEMERIIDTIEILSNPDTMDQIRQSEEDIKSGRIKEVKSARDL
jgi:PHD/YefM family antitoxin component YafN of YafNO toxin-antitoxin module